jgi:hypothetical protein
MPDQVLLMCVQVQVLPMHVSLSFVMRARN